MPSCSPNLRAHTEPVAGRAGKGVAGRCEEEDGGNTCCYRSVSITALLCGACLKGTFLSALISLFKAERVSG